MRVNVERGYNVETEVIEANEDGASMNKHAPFGAVGVYVGKGYQPELSLSGWALREGLQLAVAPEKGLAKCIYGTVKYHQSWKCGLH
jgi:hypothetical protein